MTRDYEAEFKALQEKHKTAPATVDYAALYDELQKKHSVSAPSQVLSGVGSALLKQGGAVAGMVGANDLSNKLMDYSKQGASNAQGTTGKAGSLFGSILPAMAVPQLSAAGLLPELANAGIQSALAYATTPGTNDERLHDARNAAVGYGIGSLVGKALSGAVGGFKPSEEGKALMNKDVVPTVGQGVSQDTLMGRVLSDMEDKLQSTPIVGDLIRAARNRAENEGLRAVAKSHIDVPPATYLAAPMVPGQGYGRDVSVSFQGNTMQDALSNAKSEFGKSYDNVLSGVKVPLDNEFKKRLIDYVSDGHFGIDDVGKDAVKRELDRIFSNDAIQNGVIDAAKLKNLTNKDLMTRSFKYDRSGNVSENNIGDALHGVAGLIKQHRQSFTPPSLVDAEKSLDYAYGGMKTIEKAMGSARAAKNYGQVTPSELMSAVRQNAQKTGSLGSFAQGDQRMQQDVTSLHQLFGKHLADSQTAGRLMANPLTYIMGGGAAIPGALPYMLTGIAGAAAGSTRPVQKFLLGGYKYQPSISELLENIINGRTGAALSRAPSGN